MHGKGGGDGMTTCDAAIVDLVNNITSQLMFAAIGVFAVAGGIIAAGRNRRLRETRLLVVSLGGFALSAVSGYLLQGLIVAQLSNGDFDPYGGNVRLWGIVQILLFLAASGLFVYFTARNLLSSETERGGGCADE